MFSKTAFLLTIVFYIIIIVPSYAAYSVTGKVSLKGEWQYQIFLATVNKLDNYYSDNAEFIVNTAPINVDGSFTLTGDNLPEYAQFYRLYLIKTEHSEFNACLFVGGEEHNFIHIILDNQSELEIWADTSQYAPFSDYSVVGDIENVMMEKLSQLVYPSYQFYELKFPAGIRFSRDKLNRDLFEFADTCSSTLVSLAAINNTDFDAYIETHKAQYNDFGKELNEQLKNHPYNKDYKRKLRYYKDDYYSSTAFWIWKIVSLGLALLCLILFWKIQQLKKYKKQKEQPLSKKAEIYLTSQEIRILQHIRQGKSNKEIAAELFIELSTVKSHINKLYAKLKVKNRKEAVQMAETLKN